MAQNYIESGDVLDYVVGAGETIVSGQIVEVGDLVGVALGDGTEGENVRIKFSGVFECTKVTANAVTQGQKLYVDGTGKLTTAADSGGGSPVAFNLAGHAWAAATNTATVARVKLLGTIVVEP